MGFYFTSESVSEGHPDKVADQISDALLDEFLRQDPESKVACETMVTTGLCVLAGEVRTKAWVDHQHLVRRVIKDIGYTRPEYRFDSESCGIISTIHEQSSDIHQGVVRQSEEDQGAGDQGMMFGYACNEMDNFMPMSVEISHILLQKMAEIRRENDVMTYLRPDSKSQVTIEYDDNNHPLRVDTIVISTQHDDFENDEKKMQEKIAADVEAYLIPRVLEDIPIRVRSFFKGDYKLLVNPTGKFVIGGPHGDTGLTGRKIIVDTYGGHGAHGGGAFSGKDPSKVDRSAAYAMRHVAKNLVAAGVCEEVLVQVAYAIGVAKPVGLFVNTYGTSKLNISDAQIAVLVNELFDLRPFAIIKRFGLKNPIFERTAAYGHFGRDIFEEEVELSSLHADTEKREVNGESKYFKKVKFFAWEELDRIDDVKRKFGI